MWGSRVERIATIVAMVILVGCQASGGAPTPISSESAPTESATASGSPSAPAATSAPLTVGEGEPWIVFQGAPLGLSFIRPDGSGNHVILGPPGDQVHPDWSPDGARIAYVQVTDVASDIWITDPKGTNPAPMLTEYPAALAGLFWDNPAWSPDGSQIATVAYEGHPQNVLPSRSLLSIVDVQSGEVVMAGELASSDGTLHSFPRWSPDGASLVVVLDRFSGEEYLGGTLAIVRRTETGWSEPVPITEVVDSPRADWHPTDDLIVYCTNDVGGVQSTDEASNLFTVRGDGTELTQITDFGPGGERATQPSWTSDGRIIFTHITGTDDEQLTVAFIGADGSDLEIAVGSNVVGTGNRPHPRLRPFR